MIETDQWLARLMGRMAEARQRLGDRDRAARHARMRAEVLARWPAPTRPRAWAWSLAASGLLTAALVAWVVARPEPWAARLDGSLSSRQSHLSLTASDDQPVAVSFADGSILTLRPRTRVRVETREGAVSLVLESGTVEVAPASPGMGTWVLVAGPHWIRAMGAELTVGWQPEAESFELVVHAGSVQVQGPGLEGWISAGERLRLHGTTTTVEAPGSDEPPIADEGEPGQTHPALAADDAPHLRPHPRRRNQERRSLTEPLSMPAREPIAPPRLDATWRALARDGSHAEAIAAAEAMGFAGLCASLDAEALLELADAGRYAGREDLAREALKALRRRFPGTDAAAAAAFDLGRLASLDAHGCTEAASWFRIYLDDRPAGPMSEVARRRIDECTRPSTAEEPTP